MVAMAVALPLPSPTGLSVAGKLSRYCMTAFRHIHSSRFLHLNPFTRLFPQKHQTPKPILSPTKTLKNTTMDEVRTSRAVPKEAERPSQFA